MTQPVPIHQLIGARIRQLRETKGLLQEDVAARAREFGFDWVRGTVAMVEAGHRRLTLEEFFSLPRILESAGVGDLWLEDVLPRKGFALLTPLVGTPVKVLRAMLRGESRLGKQAATGLSIRETPEVPGIAEARALWRRWWPRASAPDPGTLYTVVLASCGDAESKAARVLRVPPVTVALAAAGRWHRSLTKERDARVADQSKGSAISARTLQALRGHITRQLLDELRPLLKDITKKRGRGRR
jgi:transcriptional regulator with XRE-family HTH domain